MKHQCSLCSGSGYVKQNSEICDSCNGKKCIYCNSTGLKKLPYETCYRCFGAGEIEDNIVNIKNISKDIITDTTDNY